ncbi:hypothetical protein A2U01_0115517, partial [Trifolium medium]|nr:hypothetical protein [Trifolium medium]
FYKFEVLRQADLKRQKEVQQSEEDVAEFQRTGDLMLRFLSALCYDDCILCLDS